MDSNGWQQPVTAVSSSIDQNMRQSFALCNKSLQSVSFKKDWPTLIREYTFYTVVDQPTYPLPADFHHLVAPSAWNAAQYYAMKGSLTSMQWYRRVINGFLDWRSGFRLDTVGKTFQISPTPSAPLEIVFMYVTNLIANDVNGVAIPKFAQDTDVPLIDEDLVELDFNWRWRQKKGLDFSAEIAELTGTMNTRMAQYLGMGELRVGGDGFYNAPITQPMTGDYWPQFTS
jgi:hypothetical protein